MSSIALRRDTVFQFLAVAGTPNSFTDTVFSRPDNLVVHAERRLTGKKLHPFPLDEIQGAQIESNRTEGSRMTRLTLQLAEKRFPLEGGYRNQNLREIETAINDWLTQP